MNKVIVLYSLICFCCLACSSDGDDKDMEKPKIDMSGSTTSPQNCTIFYRGESFSFKAVFTDNQELGSYNIEIHQNFDHHSHSTDAVECDLEPKKTPIKPFVYNKGFSIPNGKTIFDANDEIEIPADVDTGDYHFMVRVTDKAGWQELKAVSIKIKSRDSL
ncbi:MAG: DUF4625 domain-containing protein [Dysgonomonas sp.]